MVDRGFPSWYFLSRTDVLRNNYRVSNSSYLPHSGQHYIFSCQQTMIDLTVTFHVAIEAKPEHLEEAFYHYHVRSEFAPRDLGIDHIRPRDSPCTLRRRICSSHPHPPPLSPLRPQVRFPSHLKPPDADVSQTHTLAGQRRKSVPINICHPTSRTSRATPCSEPQVAGRALDA